MVAIQCIHEVTHRAAKVTTNQNQFSPWQFLLIYLSIAVFVFPRKIYGFFPSLPWKKGLLRLNISEHWCVFQPSLISFTAYKVCKMFLELLHIFSLKTINPYIPFSESWVICGYNRPIMLHLRKTMPKSWPQEKSSSYSSARRARDAERTAYECLLLSHCAKARNPANVSCAQSVAPRMHLMLWLSFVSSKPLSHMKWVCWETIFFLNNTAGL